jgi:hypothetical protein
VSVRMSKVSDSATVEFGAVDWCHYVSRYAVIGKPAEGARVIVPVWDNGRVIGHTHGTVVEHLQCGPNVLVELGGGETVQYDTYSVVLV